MDQIENKVLFLDVDGVLNSNRTAYAVKGLPHGFESDQLQKFDMVALGLIRSICEETKTNIVVSSSWRILYPDIKEWEPLELPIIGMTDRNLGCRGEQIQRWMDVHQEVTHYAIVDDDSDMLESQAPHFVQTRFKDGLQYDHYMQLKDILNGKLGGLYHNALFWEHDHYSTNYRD